MKENVPSIPLGLRKITLIFICFFLLMLMIAPVSAQPVVLKRLAQGSNNFSAVNDKLYYASGDSLFTSDGTVSGTTLVQKVGEPILRISNIGIGNRLFFITKTGTQESLWISDGTAPTTLKVGTHNMILPIIAYHSELYLQIDNGVNGKELWKLNADNTLSMLKDIYPGTGSGFYGTISNIAISDDVLYFIGSPDGGTADLWKTNGTSAGTIMAVDMPFDDHFFGLTDVNGTLFFARDYLDEWDWTRIAELWKTEGTDVTTDLIKVFDGDQYNNLYHFTAMNGKLYFFRDFSLPDHYLMVSDGTEDGTTTVKLVERDGAVYEPVTFKNHLIYYSESQGFPSAIQKSNGTTAGTGDLHWLAWYNTLHSDYVNLTAADDLLFFVDDITDGSRNPAEEEDHYQLWQSDLTATNTKPLKELYNISLQGTDNVVATGNKVFFTTSNDFGFQLWYYNATASTSCAGTGGILREVWNNVSGPSVSQIPLGTPPSVQQTLTSFEGPTNAGDRYGARYQGYLCVPQTGNYRFWISSNDNSELWLSSTARPEDKTRIAYVTGYTNVRQYNKYPSQQSALIHLEKGRLYYIQALHKEGVGSDHLSVGMQLPDGTLERPITGARLVPFDDNITPTARITRPFNNQTFTGPTAITIEAEASDPDGSILKVEFYVEQPHTNNYKIGEDFTAPYSMVLNANDGEYKLSVKAFDNNGLSVISPIVTINVKSCTAAGTILREVWNGIEGSSVSSIPVNSQPSSTNYINIFEGPSNIGIHYGTRIRGYICPPQTGSYVFYISSNDNSELWISPDGNPANKIKIASVTGATGIRQWDKYASQRSANVFLQQNTRVYIEALHKQGVGSDNIAVGWMLPNGALERPIPGSYLSPAQIGISTAQARTSNHDEALVVSEEGEQVIHITPNPAKQGPVTLTLSGYSHRDLGDQVAVEIISMLGQVVNSEPIRCTGDCKAITLEINEKFSPGVYIIQGVVNQKWFSKRLVVQ